MRIRIRHIAVRFALLLGAAAVVPLIAYGAISILSLQRGTRNSVIAGNINVATRRVLHALGIELIAPANAGCAPFS